MSNLQLTLVLVGHVVLYTTVLFSMLYFFGDRLDKKHPFRIGEGSRRVIFGGVPTIGVAVFMCYGEMIAHAVGEKNLPAILCGMVAIYIAGGYALYYCVPKRLVIPLGIAGWITTFSLLLWNFVFTDPLKHFQ